MKRAILICFCFIFLANIRAQQNNRSIQFIYYFNNSQQYTFNKPNADSAFFWIKKLASDKNYSNWLTMFLHNSFAQAFMHYNPANSDTKNIEYNEKQRTFCRNILYKIMSDTSQLLKEAAGPINYWVKIEENKNNLTTLTKLTNEYISQELTTNDIYKNRVGRYGLLIYKIISNQTKLKILANKLFNIIYTDLKNNQIAATDSSSRTELDKRAWYRDLFAYVNYLEAQKYAYVNLRGEEKAHALNKEEKYLETAYNYSPDLIDKNHSSESFYDMSFLTGNKKQSFKEDYLTFLINSKTNKKQVLSTLLNIALVEPEYKNKLREYYEANITSSVDFNNYWNQAVNSSAKEAPIISLNTLNNKLFSSKNNAGKWIMIDFWGTWCMPCRKELPALQKFYDSVIVRDNYEITLLTIACKDTRQKVLEYMMEKNYNFPVAMADNKIEKAYSVQSYPTKVLITPEGKFITIPYTADWVNFVKRYCNLN